MKFSSKKTRELFAKSGLSYITPSKPKSPSGKQVFSCMNKKRDSATLKFRRCLAKDLSENEGAGLGYSKRSLQRYKLVKGRVLYRRKRELPCAKTVAKFYEIESMPNPCKNSSKTHQLTQSTRVLYFKFRRLHPSVKVSMSTFQRLKPKYIASVKRLKFRQCLCDVCENPRMKVRRLNVFLTEKIESVKALLKETVCEYDGDYTKIECIERKCPKCGVSKKGNMPKLVTELEKRLKGQLNHVINQEITWQKWETVRENGKSRMDRVKKKGSVNECVDELMGELVKLYFHVFVGEWQRQELRDLKENLPEGCAIVFLDFAENLLLRFQDEAQSAYWAYNIKSSCLSCLLYFIISVESPALKG